MTLDAHHNILMPPCTVTAHVPEVDGAETIGPKAADLEALVHVSDRHMIGIDISSQIFNGVDLHIRRELPVHVFAASLAARAG